GKTGFIPLRPRFVTDKILPKRVEPIIEQLLILGLRRGIAHAPRKRRKNQKTEDRQPCAFSMANTRDRAGILNLGGI
ncbi:MAG: hypothetical protein EBU00_12135, partial [Alphaproteobacteria bacterium]|nr:hypothetical protein [Alphaproteobacteria bacterium]